MTRIVAFGSICKRESVKYDHLNAVISSTGMHVVIGMPDRAFVFFMVLICHKYLVLG
mgnify:CR=1 FL=1